MSGRNFFTGTDAASLAVDPAMIADPNRLAAAGAAAGTLDGANAAALAELAGMVGGPDARYRSFIVELGVEVQTAKRRADIQHDITEQVDAVKQGDAGVNLDEEMVNLVQFQQAYSAAARFMTTVDEMLGRLIDGTGRVGL